MNVHWLSKDTEIGGFCFHTSLLQWYCLDANGLRTVNRAVNNILDYGVNKRLQKICGELDTYAQKCIEEMAIIHKDNLASEPPPEEQRPQMRSRRRKNAHSLAQGVRRKRTRPAPEDAEDAEEEEEEEEEGANSPASKKLQIQREKNSLDEKWQSLDSAMTSEAKSKSAFCVQARSCIVKVSGSSSIS